MPISVSAFCSSFFAILALLAGAIANATDPTLDARKETKAILEHYCYECHANGAKEGSIDFNVLWNEENQTIQKTNWHRVLKQLQADLMPPRDANRPTQQELISISTWIKTDVFQLDPKNPDPGRVTIRRLNRTEYRNAIRDLFAIEFDVNGFFPADDTGHGFDNLGDVLSISPLLLEKYVDAANSIVNRAVPTSPKAIRSETIFGNQFRRVGDGSRSPNNANSLELSYYEESTIAFDLNVPSDGSYSFVFVIKANETYVDDQFDLNKCKLVLTCDDEKLLEQEFVRQGGKQYSFDFSRSLLAGSHRIALHVTPTTSERPIRKLRLGLETFTLVGPNEPSEHVPTKDYERYFPRAVPTSEFEQKEYAKELLQSFGRKAFRRPVDEATLARLLQLMSGLRNSGKSFESAYGAALTAIIASPRFLFREESTLSSVESRYPLLDDYSLASRLSFLFWSSIPDEELLQLAESQGLRVQLDSQMDRMLHDPKAQAFYESFAGQWLQARSLDSIQINASAVQRREPKPEQSEDDAKRRRYFELLRKRDRTPEETLEFENAKAARERLRKGLEMNSEIRVAMKREIELHLEHVFRNNHSLLDLLQGQYTFLNESLAQHYGIDGVLGDPMRKIELPNGSNRGGILTTGAFLTVTSNPDRTSPVKRGLYVLENILGTPTGAPPPDVPALEEVSDGRSSATAKQSLRASLAMHRESPLCSSCHNRMDPLGLAFENYNALGRYRTEELGQPIEASGILVTGESFQNVHELKRILATRRSQDFYRCITEKFMTYALGRAVDYRDVVTIDSIVARLEASNGLAMEMVRGVVKSNAFQRTSLSND